MAVDVSQLFIAFAEGMAVGLFFFGGLWLTVRRIPVSRYPATLSLGSYFGRTILSLLAFYFIMGTHWQRLPACMGGFLVMRMILTRILGPVRKSLKPF